MTPTPHASFEHPQDATKSIPNTPAQGELSMPLASREERYQRRMDRQQHEREFSPQHQIQNAVLSAVLPPAINFIRNSWSIQHRLVHPKTQAILDSGQPVLYALWHGRQFLTVKAFNPEKTAFLVSSSRDGDMISRSIAKIGFQLAVRGSSHRGSFRAGRHITKILQEDKLSVFITVDGPKGPRYEAKMGIIKLARNAQVPIIPVTGSSKFMLKEFLNSWDHFQLPFFFSPIALQFGEPIRVPKVLQDENDLFAYRDMLGSSLREMTRSLDTMYGRPWRD